MSAVVRDAVLADARAIARIHVVAWQVAYRGLLPDAMLDGLSVERRRAQREEALRSPPTDGRRTWVFEDGEAILGFAVAGPARDADLASDALELEAIYVDPDRQGRGVGTALARAVVAHGRAAGFRELVLWVLSGNEAAQAFYAGRGWESDPRVSDEPFGQTGSSKRRLWRSLTGPDDAAQPR